MITSSRCDVCHGSGLFIIDNMDHIALFELLEGYLDKETSSEWLIKQLEKLIKERKK